MKLINFLIEYLKTHPGIIVPGFGSFVVKHTPSYVDATSNTIFPPKGILSFHGEINEDDGVFTKYLCHRLSISEEESKTLVLEFSRQLKTELQEKKKLDIPGIGKFNSEENKFIFTFDEKENFLSASIGLTQVQIQPIYAEKPKPIQNNKAIHTKKQEVPQKKQVRPVNKPSIHPKQRKAVPGWIWYAAAAIILIALASGGYFMFPELIKMPNKTTENKPVSDEKKQEIEPSLQVEELKKEEDLHVKEIEATINQQTKKENALYFNENKHFHLIAGSFSSRLNAEKLQNTLKEQGYPAEILQTQNGMFRVSIQSFKNKNEALKMLDSIRNKDGKNAVWILNL